ncbi:MAG TPA: hypothetical protein VFP80_17765 [Thermoanaerobaculia bacterium]|nr:hypothetical protein [Thermoanaerobaculia bacterium]
MIVALTQILAVGLPLAILFDRTATRLRLFGLGFLLGSGAVSLVLLALPRWPPVLVTATVLAAASVLWAVAWKRRPAFVPFQRPHLADYGTLLLVIAHARAATRTFFDEWDFWAIWGLKGRIFLEHGGIDWAWLEQPWHAFAHPDYPPLLSLNYAFYAMQAGEWNDARLGLVTTLFGAAVLLLVRDLFEPARFAPWATLGVASLALSPWVGLAEGPLIAYGTAGLLFVRRGDVPLGAVLLGLAACTKNEGLALLAAAAGALVFSGRWRDLPRLWPALAVAAPWQIVRALHTLPTDLLAGPLPERVAANFARRAEFLDALMHERPVQPELWIALLVALVIFAPHLRRERFVLIAVALQLVFYIAAFAATPRELRWHVETAATRLLEQVALPLAFALLSLAASRSAVARVEAGREPPLW